MKLAAYPFDVRPGEVEKNLTAALDAVERAAAAGAGLLVLPEKWTTSFLPAFPPDVLEASDAALVQLDRVAAEVGLIVAGSAPGGMAEGRPFNELHLLGAAGSHRPYRKRMLFTPSGEALQVARGDAPPRLIETELGKVGGIICYDLRFPEVSRPLFRAGVDILVVPAQWPIPRREVFDLLVRARAAENQCFVVACNRSGQAALAPGREMMDFPGTASVLSPFGRTVATLDSGELLVAEVDPTEPERCRRAVPCLRDLDRAGLSEA